MQVSSGTLSEELGFPRTKRWRRWCGLDHINAGTSIRSQTGSVPGYLNGSSYDINSGEGDVALNRVSWGHEYSN